jgi:hypothetical protein
VVEVVEFCGTDPPFAAVVAVVEVPVDFAEVVVVTPTEEEPTDNEAPPGDIPCP